jgi:hypothetical protein
MTLIILMNNFENLGSYYQDFIKKAILNKKYLYRKVKKKKKNKINN